MDFFDLLTMVGGLALFLYGMHLLSEGLEKLSGGRLERVLENLTNNRLKAVLLGAGVTAVIQSGIMKLSQAIGIIMGANVGTTITSWLLSLTGIESDSFFLQLLKPTSFSPVLAAIGVIFIMFLKNGRKRDLGTILVYRVVHNVYQSAAWAARRSTGNGSHTVFFRVCRYFAGVVCDGQYQLRGGSADYPRPEYRHLCDGDDVGRWRKQECQKGFDRPPFV